LNFDWSGPGCAAAGVFNFWFNGFWLVFFGFFAVFVHRLIFIPFFE
jgi:hypothetical protein